MVGDNEVLKASDGWVMLSCDGRVWEWQVLQWRCVMVGVGAAGLGSWAGMVPRSRCFGHFLAISCHKETKSAPGVELVELIESCRVDKSKRASWQRPTRAKMISGLINDQGVLVRFVLDTWDFMLKIRTLLWNIFKDMMCVFFSTSWLILRLNIFKDGVFR